jgi:murein L,D-transpeptidase YafK
MTLKNIYAVLVVALLILPPTPACRRKAVEEQKPAATVAPAATPEVVIPTPTPKKVPTKQEEIEAFLASWVRAWEARDIGAYMDHYSKEFKSGGKGFAAWKEHKKRVFAGLKSIRVELKDTKISVQDDKATVVFVQDYQDNEKKDVGEKTLKLANEQGRWMIVGEEWKPLPGGQKK